MTRKLVMAVMPAVALRYRAGTSLAVLGTMYGCDPVWLHDQLLKSGKITHPNTVAHTGPRMPWTPIRLPGRTTMP
ncbi:hypothetical protein [Kitasatospora sp. MBT66]|uniref:hypothetical protein n=1 Tax=Kitasatospora sp. MBT66 TaxID=1444769 RepID=UPI0011EA628E|nr:hypothetical protein [Kitasatospora sp. MBT66]